MAEFTVSEVVANQALTAATSYTFDLGVNGISYLWLQVAALQLAANTPVAVNNLLAALDTVQVTYNGQALWAGRALELARLGHIISGVAPWMTHDTQGANADVALSFVLPFGRRLFDTNEGLPAVLRGQLLLNLVTVGAFTNITAPRVTVQQVELPGTPFKRFNKATTRTTTPSATGNVDIPQPLGNTLRGILVFMTTRYRNINTPGSMTSAILRINNVERYWTGGQIGHAMLQGQRRARSHEALSAGARLENTGVAYTQFASTGQDVINTLEWLRNYAYVDLDPTEDDAFALATTGLSQLDLRLNMAIADQLRTVAYESVAITGGALGAGVGR